MKNNMQWKTKPKFKVGDLVVWNSSTQPDHKENGDIGVVLGYDVDGCHYFWTIAGYSKYGDDFIDRESVLLFSPQEEILK